MFFLLRRTDVGAGTEDRSHDGAPPDWRTALSEAWLLPVSLKESRAVAGSASCRERVLR